MRHLTQTCSMTSLGVVFCVMAIVTSGCGRLRVLGNTQALLTTANDRTVVARPHHITTGSARKIMPQDIVCAEPSPDVATIVSKSFTLSSALEALIRQPNIQADVAGKVAAAISITQAQALAQLTNRLAAIQLLRDGLYRACEAYANGALSDLTYAVILSGYGDVMVTLLTGELVAGNFGQSLAVLGTSASGTAVAATDTSSKDAAQLEQNQRAIQEAQENLAMKRTTRDKAEEEWRNCKPDAANCTQKERALLDAETELRKAESTFDQALLTAMGDVSAGATGQAFASIARAVGTISKDQKDISNVLGEIQRKFVERVNPDTFTVACLTVLGEPGTFTNQTALGKLCAANLATMLTAQGDLLRFKVRRDHVRAVILESCLSAIEKGQDRKAGFSGAPTNITKLCETALHQAIQDETQERLLKVRLQLGRPDGGAPPYVKRVLYAPQPGDEKLARDPVVVEGSKVLIAQSPPSQIMLHLTGRLLTPCHQLRVAVSNPDALNKLMVEVYSVASSDPCEATPEPFEVTVPLGSNLKGRYTVWVNGQQISESTL